MDRLNEIEDDLTIIELKKQIMRLNREKYINNEMFNKINDGIYITDENGTTVFVNDYFLNLSGLTRDKIIGKNVYELRDLNVLPNSCCARVIEKNAPVSTINHYYEGQKCLVSGSPIYDETGKLSRVIAVIRDVSELDIMMKSIAKEKSLFIQDKTNYIVEVLKEEKEANIILNNDKMKKIYKRAKTIASVDSTVLLLGETGVGKDFIASYIYIISNRRNTGKFIKINCAAVPEHLLEAEFFGYEEGAFTGAQRGGKKGLFEEANNGVVFLDEIGDMPYLLQVKLLSAINDKMFYRIGGTKSVKFNARIIAATNANLKNLVEEKKFRADLYYRLNVVTFNIPSLRERKEDIIPLANEFLEYYNNKYGKNCFLSTDCLEQLLNYNWPGNIRELRNIVERMLLLTDKVSIDTNLLKECLNLDVDNIEIKNKYNKSIDNLNMSSNLNLKEKIAEYEKNIVMEVLNSSKNMKEASNILGIDISTLVRKKQKYNI